MSRGLTKFQEQDLMASVEQLEDLRDIIIEMDRNMWNDIAISFNKIIDTVKGINPTLFNYPKVAKYIDNPKDFETNNTHLLNVVIQLTKIADELKKSNSLEHILTQDEKDFLCKEKVVKKRKPRRSKGEIRGEITRKHIKKLVKEKKWIH